MAKKAILISIHSRKGGVGKTSIGMSAAIQLAALSNKVAFLDLDTLGAHLSQSLPFKADMVEDGGVLKLNQEQKGKYSDKIYLVTRFLHRSTGRSAKPRLESIEQRLAIEHAVQDLASNTGVRALLDKVENGLNLFPMSPYITAVDQVNKLTMTRDGQNTYRETLADLFSEFDKNEYDYIIIDNSPGLSFNAGLSLHSALIEGRKGRPVYNWFVGNAPWWEHGLIMYEINVYSHLLSDWGVNTVLIVNRVGKKWLEDQRFTAGEYVRVDARSGEFANLANRLFCTPMWLSSGTDIDQLLMNLFPGTFGTAILGDDDNIRKAQYTDADYRSDGKQSDDEFTKDLPRDFVIMAQRYLQFFVLPSLKAVNDGLAATSSVSTQEPEKVASPDGPFHHHVYKSLVKEIIDASTGRSHE